MTMTPTSRSEVIPHPHDAHWYSEQIKRLPVPMQRKAREGYERVWLAAYEAEEVEHRRSNAARRAANIRLREYVEKFLG